MSRPRIIALLLALATLVVYLPVRDYSFVNFDDIDYIIRNPFVTHGLNRTDIYWAFTAVHSSNWHPLTWMSHMLDCQMFGLRPGAPHFINAFWHALNVAALFLWLFRLTGKLGPAALIAALFAWHPLHVESVAWISERKDVLSTFFALLTLLAYTRYAQKNKWRSFWLSLGCFALSLLAKPMMVTLPCVLLLLDFWPLKRLTPFNKKVWLEKIPFFALAAASCTVTFLAQSNHGAVISLANVPLPHRLENAVVAVACYLGKFLLPVDLCILYPLRPQIPGTEAGLALAALILISLLAWRWRLTRPYFLMGWLWFLGTLVPVIGLVQVGVQAMADRYTYFPSIGFFIMLVFLLEELAKRSQATKNIAQGLAAMACISCVLVTEGQLKYWQNSESLFRRAVSVTNDNAMAHFSLGDTLADEGQWDEALAEFRETIRITPEIYQTYNRMGNVLQDQGKSRQAVDAYRQALSLDPNIPDVHDSLGIALLALGQFPAAQAEFIRSEQLDPSYPWPHVEMAKLLFAAGHDMDALTELRTAIQIQPDNFQILSYTAHVLAANENPAARDGRVAMAMATHAVNLAGHQPMALDAMGMALAETGDFTNATLYTQSALAIAMATHLKDTNAMLSRLENYHEKLPWRESFKMTNAPANAAQ